MWPGPLAPDELTMPTPESIRGNERGHSLRGWPKSLEHGQHDALLGPHFWAADLTSEDADLLAKYEQFDVLGLGGSAGQQDEPEELTAE